MQPRRTFPVGPLTLALAAALATSAPASADEVELVPNTKVKEAISGKVRGNIQSETASEVVVKLGANTIHVPTREIVSVRYDGLPPSLVQAETNETAGQLTKAAELYGKAVAEAGAKPFVQQQAAFKHAELTAALAMADPRQADAAVAALDAFVKKYPDSRHTAPALESLARLQLQKKDYDGATATIGKLQTLPAGADRAAVLSARVDARKGDHAAAIGKLDGIIKTAPAKSVLQQEARLAKAESLAGLKKYAEAEAEAREVIKALPPEDAASQSVAYNTLGDCLRAAGKPKDALIAYLHTDLLYSKDREQHPRALAQIARLWAELKQDTRADEVRERLLHDYPQSPWAASASANP